MQDPIEPTTAPAYLRYNKEYTLRTHGNAPGLASPLWFFSQSGKQAQTDVGTGNVTAFKTNATTLVLVPADKNAQVAWEGGAIVRQDDNFYIMVVGLGFVASQDCSNWHPNAIMNVIPDKNAVTDGFHPFRFVSRVVLGASTVPHPSAPYISYGNDNSRTWTLKRSTATGLAPVQSGFPLQLGDPLVLIAVPPGGPTQDKVQTFKFQPDYKLFCTSVFTAQKLSTGPGVVFTFEATGRTPGQRTRCTSGDSTCASGTYIFPATGAPDCSCGSTPPPDPPATCGGDCSLPTDCDTGCSCVKGKCQKSKSNDRTVLVLLIAAVAAAVIFSGGGDDEAEV